MRHAALLLLLLPATAPGEEIPELAARLSTAQACEAAEQLASLGRASRAALAELSTALESRDLELRWRAAWALSRMGPDAAPALPMLLRAWARGHDLTSAAAAVALRRVGPEATAPVLEAITKARGEQRNALVELLGTMDLEPRSTLRVLLPLLDARDETLTRTLRRVMEKAVPGAGEFTTEIVKRWADVAMRRHNPDDAKFSDWIASRLLRDAILASGPAVVEPLGLIAKDSQWHVEIRSEAAGTLACLGPAGIATAAGVLDAVDEDVFWGALFWIRDAGPGAAELVPLLQRRILGSSDPSYDSAQTLLALGSSGADAVEAVLRQGGPQLRGTVGFELRSLAWERHAGIGALLLRVASIDREVARDCMLALADLPLADAQAGEAMRLAEGHMESETAAACRLAGSLGALAEPLERRIQLLLKSEDVSVRAEAASARCRLGLGGSPELAILRRALKEHPTGGIVECFGRAGRVAAAEYKLLLALLKPREERFRSGMASRALAQLYPLLSPGARASVLTAFLKEEQVARFYVAQDLVRSCNAETLVDLLDRKEFRADDRDGDAVRDGILSAGPQAWEPLCAALARGHPEARAIAARCLVVIDPARAPERAWREVLRLGPEGLLEPCERARPEALALLRQVLPSGTPEERASAATLLGQMRDAEAIPTLWQIARDKANAKVRPAALAALDTLLPPP